MEWRCSNDPNIFHICKKFRIIKVCDIFEYEILKLMNRYHYGLLTQRFSSVFKYQFSTHSCNTRSSVSASSTPFSLPSRAKIYSIVFIGTKFWSALQPAFRALPLYTFDKQYLDSVFLIINQCLMPCQNFSVQHIISHLLLNIN